MWVGNSGAARLAGPGLILFWVGRQVLVGPHGLRARRGLEDPFFRWSLFPWGSLWFSPASSGHGGRLPRGGRPERPRWRPQSVRVPVSPQIWHHSFYQVLHVAPEQHPLMVTEPPLNPLSNKEQVSQVRGQVGDKGSGSRLQAGELGLPRPRTVSGGTETPGESCPL